MPAGPLQNGTTGEPGSIRSEIIRHLTPLIGLKLSATFRAADMRSFIFDDVAPAGTGERTGELNLHIQSPWRIDGRHGIITGRSDLWEPAEPRPDWESLVDYDKEPNLQDRRLGELLSAHGGEGNFIVERVDADDFGGAVLHLSGDCRITIFPAGSASEDWRLFGPSSPRHFVVSGGKIEPDDANRS